MADLTWAQLAAALPANAIVFANNTITIDAELVTGDGYTALSDEGVAEFMHKLLNACAAAQTTLNATLPSGSRLQAFPRAAFGVPAADTTGNFFTTATHTCQFSIPLNPNSVSGQTG